MAQVTIYLDKNAAQKARRAARHAGLSLSGWLRAMISNLPDSRWPDDFDRLYGSVPDPDFVEPADLPAERVPPWR
jgi:hypothetical protein